MFCLVFILCVRIFRDFLEEGFELFISRFCVRVFFKKKGKYLGFYYVYVLIFLL